MKNKAGYTATEVACGGAGAIFECHVDHLGRSSVVQKFPGGFPGGSIKEFESTRLILQWPLNAS